MRKESDDLMTIMTGSESFSVKRDNMHLYFEIKEVMFSSVLDKMDYPKRVQVTLNSSVARLDDFQAIFEEKLRESLEMSGSNLELVQSQHVRKEHDHVKVKLYCKTDWGTFIPQDFDFSSTGWTLSIAHVSGSPERLFVLQDPGEIILKKLSFQFVQDFFTLVQE